MFAHTDQFEVDGDVRHVTPTAAGHALLGVVFKDLTELDEMILAELRRGLVKVV